MTSFESMSLSSVSSFVIVSQDFFSSYISFPYSDRAHEVEDERDVDRHGEEVVRCRSVGSAPELKNQEDDSNELPTQELEDLAWSDECEEANQWSSEPISANH
jgi:hypothetical protein